MPVHTPYSIVALPGVPEASADGVLVTSPRGRMLDAMTATVAERGYAATSIAEVIKRARASRSTFYEQFADKEDCYLAAYQLASNYVAAQIGKALESSPPNLADRLTQIYETFLGELANIPLAARAFFVEIRAAGAPSRQHRRAVNDQFAELLVVPGGDDDPIMRIAVIAASEEIIVREITDNGTENLPRLAAPLTRLATRILTPASRAEQPS
jgi:AcrR family transcriptional regulator